MEWDPIAKLLILVGALAIGAGLFWQFGGPYLKLGKLPGDIAIERDNFKFYFPITTSLLLSLVFAVLAWLWRRFGG